MDEKQRIQGLVKDAKDNGQTVTMHLSSQGLRGQDEPYEHEAVETAGLSREISNQSISMDRSI